MERRIKLGDPPLQRIVLLADKLNLYFNVFCLFLRYTCSEEAESLCKKI